jgi:glycosyl hydrolase family 16
MPRARFAPLVGLVVSLAVGFAVTAGPSTAPPTEARSLQQVSTTYPTNAAKIFRWGNAAWKDEFVRPLSSSTWQANHPSLVRDQHGMLTLDSTRTSGDVVAAAKISGSQYGRWEARVRTRSYKGSGTPYRAVWELAPTSGGEHCGARGIELSDYPIGAGTASMHVRNTPASDFTTSKTLPLNNVFHTYAFEVTPDHVSWFVDTRVVMTERRPAALSGAVFAPRFRLVATPGATMRRGRMQMDWVRYYTLQRKNARSIAAPQASQGSYADPC